MENLSVSQCEGKIVICTFGNYLLIVMLGRNEGVRNMITCWTKLYSTRVEVKTKDGAVQIMVITHVTREKQAAVRIHPAA